MEAVENIPLPDASLGAGFLTKIRQSGTCSITINKFTHPLVVVVATRESSRIANVKGMTAFP